MADKYQVPVVTIIMQASPVYIKLDEDDYYGDQLEILQALGIDEIESRRLEIQMEYSVPQKEENRISEYLNGYHGNFVTNVLFSAHITPIIFKQN